jgi:hypothetical protein
MNTKDTDDRPVVEQLPAGGETVDKDITTHRRKIIKASAMVVPAIMTLRSGAAAALTSSASRCLNDDTRFETADVGSIDQVLGDEDPAQPLDEWLRVVAIPGMILMYATGNSAAKPYYLIRKDNTSSNWTELDGWRIYNEGGDERDNLRDKAIFMTDWNNGEAVEFYGVDPYPGDMVFVNESGDLITVPGPVSSHMKTSTTRVYLLAYYNVDTKNITYHPMPQGQALAITTSCLCSINPAFQL